LPGTSTVVGVPHFELTTEILASPEECFDLSLDVDLHTRSTGAREEIVGGVRSGQMALGDDVTWKAWHFGIPFRMTARIVEYERPSHFVDEQTRGPFASWRHEHRFEGANSGTRMTDVIDYRSPFGPIGVAVDRLRLERYMVELLERRNEFLRQAAEATR
jgi:ligand-binding SRPBCC domain-containing protein